MKSNRYKINFENISFSSAMSIRGKREPKRYRFNLKKHDIKTSFQEVGRLIGHCIERQKKAEKKS